MSTITPQASIPRPAMRPRRRRWLRWTLAGITALVVLIVAAIVAAIKLSPTPEPLALKGSAAAPVGPLEGTWQVAPGSVAGFRIEQTVLGLTSVVVGRTEDITGTVAITGGKVASASLRINLLALTTGGREPAPQFGISLDTEHYPNATVNLGEPAALVATFASGATTSVTMAGELTLHGVTRAVTAELSARRNGAELHVAGAIPIKFADWGVARPEGYGWLGSLADHGVAEFLIVLQRS
jgi:polyisoprenoid-binding protein YceI